MTMEFDEDFYLAHNPDVARAVAAGIFQSGREHFDRAGRDEGRLACLGETTMLPATSLADMSRPERDSILLEALQAGFFDFLDLGSHFGNSIENGKKIGGRRGLGIELDEAKSLALLRRGFYVLTQDILSLPELPMSVDFAICSHVLEHLSSQAAIFLTLQRLSRLCRKFIMVEQPDFSSELYLYRKGLKMAHSTMEGHNCHIQTRDLINMLWSLDLGRFILGSKYRIHDSTNPWIHRADAEGPSLWLWDEIKDLPKPFIEFDRQLFRDIVLIIGCDEAADIDELAEKAQVEKVIMRCFEPLM